MYQYLTGKLVEKTPAAVTVDVNGIGYLVSVPVSTFSALPEVGANVRLLTHFVVREDAQILYGFYDEDERQLFRLLISVSGIGPKTAMTVISGIPLPELKSAIIDGNLTVLSSISGIGRKTAERMVIELREKIVICGQHRSTSPSSEKIQGQDALVEDSLQALIELGYKKQNAKDAIQKALKNGKQEFTVPDLIRASLKYV